MESLVNKNILRSYYTGKKVFITGHTGFKGTWLSLWLESLGATVKGYALAPELPECIFNLVNQDQKIESIIADIRDKERLKKEIISFQPDYIFHLAAQPLVLRSYEIPSETFEVNAVGTANVLESIIHLNKKCAIVIITTDKVYENKEQDILYKEDDRLGGFDPYSASKACAELVVNSFRNSFFNNKEYALHQKSIVSVRAGNVIGGGDFSQNRIIPDIVRYLRENKEILLRNPNSVRPWQHVLEPLGGYLLLGGMLYENNSLSGAYNFGPYEKDHLTVKELATIAINMWGKGKYKNDDEINKPHEAGLLKLSIDKAINEINWHPKWSAQQAVEATIDWYKNASEHPYTFTLEQINHYMQL